MQAPLVAGDTFSGAADRVARSLEEFARAKHVMAPLRRQAAVPRSAADARTGRWAIRGHPNFALRRGRPGRAASVRRRVAATRASSGTRSPRGADAVVVRSRNGSIRTRDPCRVLIGPTSARYSRDISPRRRVAEPRDPRYYRAFRASSSGPYNCLKIVVSPVRVRVSPSRRRDPACSGIFSLAVQRVLERTTSPHTTGNRGLFSSSAPDGNGLSTGFASRPGTSFIRPATGRRGRRSTS
jgi:hypothetical protein